MTELKNCSLRKMQYQIVLLIIFGVWLLALSVLFYWSYAFFRRLTKGVKENELARILNRILKIQGENTEEIKRVARGISKLEEDGKNHVQKVGIVRFNPFKEIGGDHSFSLANLDGRDSGVIITCLHTRERTRVYMKSIVRGKSELDLSDEEKKALAKAIRS